MVVGEDLAAAVAPLADELARDVLADEQVQIGVVGHAVALARGAQHLDDAAAGRVLAPDVAGHVGEEQVMLGRVPDRPLGEREPGGEVLDTRALLHEVVDRGRPGVDPGHCGLLYVEGAARDDARGGLDPTSVGAWRRSIPAITEASVSRLRTLCPEMKRSTNGSAARMPPASGW